MSSLSDNQLRKYASDRSPSSMDTFFKSILSSSFLTQKLLIDKDPSLVDQADAKSRSTLLLFSVRNDNYPLAEYLIEKGAEINRQNLLGETPLHKAVENGSHKMINFLLDKGANPNIQQEQGETPMHIAASKGDYKVIKLLLLYLADPSILTSKGYLAEDYANERGNQKCVDVLAKALNEKDISNNDSSPMRVIKDQFSPENNKGNGTCTPSSKHDLTSKKKPMEIQSNNNLHPNIVLSNPSDDDLIQTDCDNVRYNGLTNYNRTPNNKAIDDNNHLRGIHSDRNLCHFNELNRDSAYSDQNQEEEEECNEDNVIVQYKLPFEKVNDFSDEWLQKSNQHLSTLISITEVFKDLCKEQIIFHSEKNDIIEEVYLRQSTVRVSLKKNNTLKNSKFVQNTYQDEYELEDEHNYCSNQLETVEDKQDKENALDFNDTTGRLNQQSSEEKELFNYLKVIEMEQYTELLIKQGFDDLLILIGQMKTKRGITDGNLKEAGITKPGHRARILLKLQLDANAFEPRVHEGTAFYHHPSQESADYTKDDNLKSLYHWLHSLKLASFFTNFYSNGYHSIDLLYLQALSKNPLTEEILEKELQIPKLGFRLRILNKLQEDSAAFLSRMRINTNNEVEFQSEMKGESCRCLLV